ncbi:hypothetical protein HQ35_06620 [Porphyromonas cangingivalis]|uniref:Uncharacterized protein n=2 Tax=Porphyromonas cangingivalis TaxID=36874 RepID=A0A0A2EQP8_PORCN|nr:hypothetical protein HQ35_06620 [Porphyromonas cangingivalis]
MSENFVNQLNTHYNTEANVYNSIFEQYERVIMQSLITSFGLDFLVSDQHGGDVDTVHNVRQIDRDVQMKYKSKRNRVSYNNRENYDGIAYHKGGNFQQKKHEAREIWQATGKSIKDEYTNGNIGFHGHTKSIPPSKKAELDHIIAAKEVHEDRARLLSGLNGKELADTEDNFAWTNKSLNASMQDKSIQEYIEAHPELDEDTKTRMLKKDKQARKAYDEKINKAYYTSSAFFKDTAKAAGKIGFTMGLRQALGLVFSEIWFSVRDKIKQGKEDGEALFNSIASGIRIGLESAKLMYKDLWNRFIEGAVSGILASLTTTLCNIFFTTAKNVVRIIRQSWASLVEATKILLFNPDLLPFGERFRSAVKIIATGASVVAGTMIGDLIAKTGIAAVPIIGDVIQTFCGTFVTGIMSCSLLYLLDSNPAVNKIVQVLNSIPTADSIVGYYNLQAQLLEEYCAKLMDIDVAEFKKETRLYSEAVFILENASNQQDLNTALRMIYERLEITSPLGSYRDMDSFMADPNSKLKFC